MSVGERLRAVRLERKLTVGSLAERTGLSKGLISQVENGKTSPSIATLERLAESLEVPAAYLLLKSDEQIQVVRTTDRAIYQFGPDRLTVELLSGRGRQMKVVLVEMPPGTSTGNEAHAHAGEEFHMVLAGQVEATQGDQSVTLEAGDALHWNGFIPHRVRNVGTTPARVLAVTSTTVMDILGEE